MLTSGHVPGKCNIARKGKGENTLNHEVNSEATLWILQVSEIASPSI